jgi:hypothetical protein
LADAIGPAYIVEISPEGRALAYGGATQDAAGAKATGRPDQTAAAQNPAASGAGQAVAGADQVTQDCQTCASRKYVDGSNDASVSFQTPTHIDPGSAAAGVAAHENEHVRNERASAQSEGREVVSQNVRLFTAVCPECGRIYVSGGETRTVTASARETQPANPSEKE